jgi:hypothetical protein
VTVGADVIDIEEIVHAHLPEAQFDPRTGTSVARHHGVRSSSIISLLNGMIWRIMPRAR